MFGFTRCPGDELQAKADRFIDLAKQARAHALVTRDEEQGIRLLDRANRLDNLACDLQDQAREVA